MILFPPDSWCYEASDLNHSGRSLRAIHLTSVAALFAVAHVRGATITVEFGPAPDVTPDYKEVHVEIGDLRKEGAWKNATKRVTHEATFKETFHVPVGTYLVRVFTGPAEEMTMARPGAF